MIDFLFTLDYEIYGNGTGSLTDLVYKPTERLRSIFQKWKAPFVVYVEAAELEKIEQYGSDKAIDLVTSQIRAMYREGHEIALHLHPQWFNGHFEQGEWRLDSSEYNLCTLSAARISEMVQQSLGFLRRVLDQPRFTPLSFRAGNWLFQPTQTAAAILVSHGIRVDSSVFKGGLQHNYHLDYRPALRNSYYWRFSSQVNKPDSRGEMIEVPIHTQMVPFWRMATGKRLRFSNNMGIAGHSAGRKWNRIRDLMRFRYPLKLDFCRMTLNELTAILNRIICEDQKDPNSYKPIVSIGHSKDLTDPETVDALLTFLHTKKIRVNTFQNIYPKLVPQKEPSVQQEREVIDRRERSTINTIS